MDARLEIIEQARIYLRGKAISGQDFIELYNKLVHHEQFGYASEVLFKNIHENIDKGQMQSYSRFEELAKNVYKDTTLSSYFKFTKALNILKVHCCLESTTSSEVLGLAGSIYKNKWKFDHQIHNLLKAASYYSKGYKYWKENINLAVPQETDFAYTAINLAYVHEMVAVDHLENLSSITGVNEDITLKYLKSSEIRLEIIRAYTEYEDNKPLDLKETVKPCKWIYAILAESYFGLRKYDNALHYIELYLKENALDWEVKTFMRQVYHLAYMQTLEKKFAAGDRVFNTDEIDLKIQQKCLAAFNVGSENCETNINNQEKVGICLSGGGFRAALFHIGILAGLAEQDKLKDIEVISCVSGGSIIGTYYYLKLKSLLESKSDADIDKSDYINIIAEIEKDFLQDVQKNLRMRLFSNFFKNIKMLLHKDYSRSHRLGELYEDFFFRKLLHKKQGEDIVMQDLFIIPKDGENFDISENWKRKHKVPKLILNATTVNTGHNWQFTASWMGEPPGFISTTFDVKPRLRRMYYSNAPAGYDRFRLGYAVAASSCVPVLFEPLVLKGLYEGIDLELIDGGVHDNQGIASVLEQECDHVIISDGSAQMRDDNKTTDGELSLFFRVDNILQERLREIQLLDMKSREYTMALNRLRILHLKSELNQQPISWIDCTDVPRLISFEKEVEEEDTLLSYGIMKKIQKGLSELRTDLDSHNDLESYALMYSGYQQISSGTSNSHDRHNWDFLAVSDACTIPAEADALMKQLDIGHFVPFKILHRYKMLRYLLFILLLCILGIICLNLTWNSTEPVMTYGAMYKSIALIIILFVIGLFSKTISAVANPRGWMKQKGLLLLVVLFGFFMSNLYLMLINPLYNLSGKVKTKKV